MKSRQSNDVRESCNNFTQASFITLLKQLKEFRHGLQIFKNLT